MIGASSLAFILCLLLHVFFIFLYLLVLELLSGRKTKWCWNISKCTLTDSVIQAILVLETQYIHWQVLLMQWKHLHGAQRL